MGIIDLGRISIPFHFYGCVVNLKVTKFSTCDDVIHMVLHKMNLPVSKATLYAVYERTSSVERMLHGKTLVYKVYRSWGCESDNFQFHIKSKSAKDQCLGIKRNLANSSAEGEIDGLFISHYTRKTEHTCTIATEHERKESIVRHPEPTHSVHAPLKLNEDSLNKHDTSASGKQMVLARFMYDVASRSANKPGNKKYREQGDGADRDDFCRRQGDGSESDHIYVRHNKIRSQYDRGINFFDQTYIIESESNTDSVDNLSDDDHVSFHDDAASFLDTAFLKTSAGSDSDEGIDVTSVDSDLDVAFNEEYLITNTRANSLHLKSPHPCEYIYVIKNNTLDNNVCADKLVKELFGRAHNISEDEAMDSFMRSRVDSF